MNIHILSKNDESLILQGLQDFLENIKYFDFFKKSGNFF